MNHLLPTTLASFSSLFVPKSGGSPNADQIDSLYKITLYIALVIFVSVEGALGYALWKFRKRKGAVAAQIHGNTRLEIGWTLGAALILVVLSVLTFVKLSSIQDPPNSSAGGDALGAESGELYATADKHLPPNSKSLEIQVVGRQFIWQYVYPGATNHDGLGAPYAYTEMVVPTKTTVTLDIVSSDVVHSWWIPALGGKYQAIPGYHNYGWFKIEQARRLPRAVRQPLRSRSRPHGRDRARRGTGRIRHLAGQPEADARRSPGRRRQRTDGAQLPYRT